MSNTILIGLDGATFTILDPLMEQGVMPYLAELTARGSRGLLMSTPHPLTPQAWPALMTGRSPGNHGVFDFVSVERGTDHPRYSLATSSDVSCETLWSIAGRQQRRVMTLNFPLMFPPQPINGFMVPGFVPWRHLRRAVYPPELFKKLKSLPGFDPKELSLDLDLEKQAIQSLPEGDYEDWIRLHTRRERQWFSIAHKLMSEESLDLIAVLFDGVDKLQHVCWRFLDPAVYPAEPTEWEADMRELCLDYFRSLDSLIEQIVDLGGQDARLFFASDHGFGPTHEIFYANVWLADHGYLAWKDGVEVDQQGLLHTDGHRSTTVLFDWNKTKACALTPSSNGIFIQMQSEPGGPGVPVAEYESFRTELIAALLDFRDPATHLPVVTEVLTREDAFPGAKMSRAPDLTLVLKDHGFISVVRASEPVRQRPAIDGTHRPEGIFIAAGPGICAASDLAPLSILDVAPTLLYSLGLPIPQDLEGRFPEEIFDAELLRVNPPIDGEPTFATGAPEATDPKDSEGDEEVMERLRALGYLA